MRIALLVSSLRKLHFQVLQERLRYLIHPPLQKKRIWSLKTMFLLRKCVNDYCAWTSYTWTDMEKRILPYESAKENNHFALNKRTVSNRPRRLELLSVQTLSELAYQGDWQNNSDSIAVWSLHYLLKNCFFNESGSLWTGHEFQNFFIA